MVKKKTKNRKKVKIKRSKKRTKKKYRKRRNQIKRKSPKKKHINRLKSNLIFVGFVVVIFACSII